jgi:hypothetical protein
MEIAKHLVFIDHYARMVKKLNTRMVKKLELAVSLEFTSKP